MGGAEEDLDLQLLPTVEGTDVQIDFSLSNKTETGLTVAAVAQLVALDGTIVQELPASEPMTAVKDGVLASEVAQVIHVPEGYYTLWITALGIAPEQAEESERTMQAVAYVHSDGTQARLIDYSEWYFNSGAVTFGPSDEEHN